MTLYIPPQRFSTGTRLSKPEWQRRYKQFAVADFAEGARRDRYDWERYREPYSVRMALSAEYDGARIDAGLSITEHRHALVIVRAAGKRLERLFLPVDKPVSPDSLPPQHWFQFAEDYGLWNDWTVIEDSIPVARGAA